MNLRFIGILLAVSMLGFSWMYEALAYGIATERCRESTTYGPADSVIYRPGLDIKGRAVVPADLGSNKGISIPSDIDIEIIINLRDQLGRGRDLEKDKNMAPLFVSGEWLVGQLSLRGTNLYWNDKLIIRDSQAACVETVIARERLK
ncbi:MAG: hypothetical protein ACJZ9F_05050 [Rhodospirillaceae bacterium]